MLDWVSLDVLKLIAGIPAHRMAELLEMPMFKEVGCIEKKAGTRFRLVLWFDF